VGKTIYVAGQTATDEEGNIIGKEDMITQTDHAYENIMRVLEAAGASITNIVMLKIYCTDLESFEKTGLLLPEAMVEVEAMAVLD
jgi:enamine deaminase RidA (YjgF/YER057c/UK114 family)